MTRVASQVRPVRCQSCHVHFGLEPLRFDVTTFDGTWTLCTACVEQLIARMQAAHAEALEILEDMPMEDA